MIALYTARYTLSSARIVNSSTFIEIHLLQWRGLNFKRGLGGRITQAREEDPLLFSLDPDPIYNNGLIKLFHLEKKYKPESTNSSFK